MDPNKVILILQTAGQLIPVANGEAAAVFGAINSVRDALAARGVEVDDAALDRLEADAERRANLAKQEAEGGPAPEAA